MLCPLCFPGAKIFGEVIPGYVFAKYKGEYLIISGDGHAGHECASFPIARKCRTMRMISNGGKCHQRIFLRPTEGYEFVNTAIKTVGYGRKNDGYFEVWLYERLAKMCKA